jgi:hypothetical protein
MSLVPGHFLVKRPLGSCSGGEERLGPAFRRFVWEAAECGAFVTVDDFFVLLGVWLIFGTLSMDGFT